MNKLGNKVKYAFERGQDIADRLLELDLQRDFIKELRQEHKQQKLLAEFFTSIISNIVSNYDNSWELPVGFQRNTFFERNGKLSVVLYREQSKDYESYFIYDGESFTVYKTINGTRIGKKKFNSLEDLLLQDFTMVEWEEWK